MKQSLITSNRTFHISIKGSKETKELQLQFFGLKKTGGCREDNHVDIQATLACLQCNKVHAQMLEILTSSVTLP